MKDITFSLIEIFISLVVETIILGALFTWIGNKSAQRTEQQINNDLKNIEEQNKTDFKLLQSEIRLTKSELISQIKESEQKR